MEGRLVFDSKHQRYWSKDGKQLVQLEEWAGVFNNEELVALLKDKYGSSDKWRYATRCTVLNK